MPRPDMHDLYDRDMREMFNDLAAEDAEKKLREGWQPMATAPKDGTWILAYAPDGEWQRVSWGRNYFGDLTWCSSRMAFPERGKFTFWRQLPDPPNSND